MLAQSTKDKVKIQLRSKVEYTLTTLRGEGVEWGRGIGLNQTYQQSRTCAVIST